MWGSPDIHITEAGDPIQFKTDSDHVRIRIKDGKVLIEVLGKDEHGLHWNAYTSINGELELDGIFSIQGGI